MNQSNTNDRYGGQSRRNDRYGQQNPPPRQPYRGEDVERASFAVVFEDPSVRRAFIRKVFSILFVQLSITTAIVATAIYYEPIQKEMFKKPWLGFVFLCGYLALAFTIICYEHCRRNVPLNFILLTLLTILMGCSIAFFAIKYRPELVLMAFGITAGLCFLLTIFAMQTKIDFTVCGTGLFIALIILFVAGIIGAFFPSKIYVLIFSSFGAFLFSIYFIFDVQLMMGGNHAYSISPEEYIMAALSLYIDVINIFIYILQILGVLDDY